MTAIVTPRRRYYCPNLGSTRYPTWEHPAVREGNCTVVPREDLAKEPLPPNSKVLLYGNSYLRQASAEVAFDSSICAGSQERSGVDASSASETLLTTWTPEHENAEDQEGVPKRIVWVGYLAASAMP